MSRMFFVNFQQLLCQEISTLFFCAEFALTRFLQMVMFGTAYYHTSCHVLAIVYVHLISLASDFLTVKVLGIW